MADEDDVMEEEDSGGGYEPTASSGLNKIVKILIYVRPGRRQPGIDGRYQLLRGPGPPPPQQYKEVASIAVVKPPPPTENFNFPEGLSREYRGPRVIRISLSCG